MLFIVFLHLVFELILWKLSIMISFSWRLSLYHHFTIIYILNFWHYANEQKFAVIEQIFKKWFFLANYPPIPFNGVQPSPDFISRAATEEILKIFHYLLKSSEKKDKKKTKICKIHVIWRTKNKKLNID